MRLADRMERILGESEGGEGKTAEREPDAQAVAIWMDRNRPSSTWDVRIEAVLRGVAGPRGVGAVRSDGQEGLIAMGAGDRSLAGDGDDPSGVLSVDIPFETEGSAPPGLTGRSKPAAAGQGTAVILFLEKRDGRCWALGIYREGADRGLDAVEREILEAIGSDALRDRRPREGMGRSEK